MSKKQENENNYFNSATVSKFLKKILMILGVTIFLEICLLTYFLGTYKYIYNGVYVGNINLGGLTRKEAVNVLIKELPNIIDKEITFGYEDYLKTINLSEICSEINYEALAMNARQVGREGSLVERFITVCRISKKKKILQPNYKVDITNLRNIVYGIKSELDNEVIEAKINKEIDKDFEIIPEVPGKHVMIDETIEKFNEFLQIGDFEKTVEIVVQNEMPTITTNYLKTFSTLLGEYSTDCSTSSWGRLENLKNACSKLNGTILPPDEELSFNSTIGPVNTANGYASAGIILNGRPSSGIGGGICQVSTTLYNAVLYSQLEVIARRNHSLSVAYVPLGRDAAVSEGTLDFKFKNISSLPIYIEAYVQSGKVVVKIYGDPSYKEYDSIELENKILKVIQPLGEIVTYDSTLAPGTRVRDSIGVKGYNVELYKKCFKDGEQVNYELVNKSNYSASATYVRVSDKSEDFSNNEIASNIEENIE